MSRTSWVEANVLDGWLTLIDTKDEAPVKAEGAWVETGSRRFLDAGSYGLSFFGHRHPRVIEAVVGQLERSAWSSRCLASPVTTEAAGLLAARFAPAAPLVQFFSTGAEAADAALRLVAAKTRRAPRALTVAGNFHGLTIGTLGVNGRRMLRRASGTGWEVVEVDWRRPEAAIEEVRERPVDVAFFEPVQGEMGVVFPPPGAIGRVIEAVREGGGLAVLDEIQVGLGRLGRYWGKDIEGLPWDAVLVGKALGGGVIPVSALVMGEELAEVAQANAQLLLTTFGGSPLAGAAVTAALKALDTDGLVEAAARIGEVVGEVFAGRGLQEDERVVELRGRGTLWGVELANQPLATEAMRRIVAAGVLVARPVLTQKVVRLTVPAVVTETEAAWLAGVVADAILTGTT